MKLGRTPALVGVAALVATSVQALQRASVQLDIGDEEWSRSAPCAIRYYNICTGWASVDLLGADEKIGVLIDACDGTSLLQQTSMYSLSSGYTQFASTVSIHEVDADGLPLFPPLAIQSLPYFCSTGYPCYEWRTLTWDIGVPATFMFLFQQSWDTGQFRVLYDHPAAGPTGPQACGYCYASSRITRTFFWPAGEITGPGQRLNDGTCDVELMVSCQLEPLVTAVDPPSESMSWGGVKALYR